MWVGGDWSNLSFHKNRAAFYLPTTMTLPNSSYWQLLLFGFASWLASKSAASKALSIPPVHSTVISMFFFRVHVVEQFLTLYYLLILPPPVPPVPPANATANANAGGSSFFRPPCVSDLLVLSFISGENSSGFLLASVAGRAQPVPLAGGGRGGGLLRDRGLWAHGPPRGSGAGGGRAGSGWDSCEWWRRRVLWSGARHVVRDAKVFLSLSPLIWYLLAFFFALLF